MSVSILEGTDAPSAPSAISVPSPSSASDNQIIGDSAAPYALIAPAGRSIGTIIPNVTIREVHTDEDTITVFPVETGTPISDHVFANPKLVEITCGFSDATGGFSGYVQQVYEAFLALKAQREPFDVSTGKRLYQNMLFANLTVITDETSEYALMVTAKLQEVIISDTDGGSGIGTQSDQAYPQQSAATTDLGSQQLQAAPNASLYQDYESGFGPSPGTDGSNI